MVRDDGTRSLLFDLDTAIQRLSADVPDHPSVVQLTSRLPQPPAPLGRDVAAGLQTRLSEGPYTFSLGISSRASCAAITISGLSTYSADEPAAFMLSAMNSSRNCG